MTTYQYQSLDASYEDRRARRLPSGFQSYATQPKPADFTDRQIEKYMLPHPRTPSLSLQALYAAIRNQMVLDGCTKE